MAEIQYPGTDFLNFCLRIMTLTDFGIDGFTALDAHNMCTDVIKVTETLKSTKV